MLGSTKTTVSVVIVVIIIAAALLYGMSQGPKTPEQPIKIGFTTALSGNYAYIGNDILKGVQEVLTNADEKNLFKRELELLIEDNQADPTKQLPVINTLKRKMQKSSFPRSAV